MKEVLVTGACGSIGARVVALLVERGCAVRALDLDTPVHRARLRPWGAKVRAIFGEICNEAVLRDAVAGATHVIHLAAVLPPHTDADQFAGYRVNVGGTRALLKVCAAQDVLPCFVFASSAAVYGSNATACAPRRADEALAPQDSYGLQKAEAEALVRAAGIDHVIFRLSLTPLAAPPALSTFIFEFHPQMRVEFLHPADAAHALVNALDVEAVRGRTLMLGGGANNRYRYREWLNMVCVATGSGELPLSAFGEADYLTDWVDSDESEALLHYRRHDYHSWLRETAADMSVSRRLLGAFPPLARRYVLAYSAREAAALGRRPLLIETQRALTLLRLGLTTVRAFFGRRPLTIQGEDR